MGFLVNFIILRFTLKTMESLEGSSEMVADFHQNDDICGERKVMKGVLFTPFRDTETRINFGFKEDDV